MRHVRQVLTSKAVGGAVLLVAYLMGLWCFISGNEFGAYVWVYGSVVVANVVQAIPRCLGTSRVRS